KLDGSLVCVGGIELPPDVCSFRNFEVSGVCKFLIVAPQVPRILQFDIKPGQLRAVYSFEPVATREKAGSLYLKIERLLNTFEGILELSRRDGNKFQPLIPGDEIGIARERFAGKFHPKGKVFIVERDKVLIHDVERKWRLGRVGAIEMNNSLRAMGQNARIDQHDEQQQSHGDGEVFQVTLVFREVDDGLKRQRLKFADLLLNAGDGQVAFLWRS